MRVKVRPHLHANTNDTDRGEADANICLDCNTMQNVVVCGASEWFSLKYKLQADSVCSASDRTEAVFLSSVTRLHCYECLASACVTRVFVSMWMQLNASTTSHTRNAVLLRWWEHEVAFTHPVPKFGKGTSSKIITFI